MGYEKFKVSLAKKIIVGLGAIIFLFTTKFAFDSIMAVNAFTVVGEVWVQAQEEQVYNLKLFGATGDDADYDRFNYFQVLLDDFRKAHYELNEKRPNREVVEQGFLLGRISLE